MQSFTADCVGEINKYNKKQINNNELKCPKEKNEQKEIIKCSTFEILFNQKNPKI